MHGFPTPWDAGLHATVTRNLRSTSSLTAHRLDLDDSEVVTPPWSDGLRFTARTRTAVDCLRISEPGAARSLFAWLSTRQVLTRAQLAAEIRDRPGRWGTATLLDVLRRSAGGALSAAETRLHRILRTAGLHGWEANVPVVVRGRTVAVADVLFREARVIVEVDGWAAHNDREAFERDRQRQNVLVNAGYVVLRFTWRDLTEREPTVLAQIRDAVDRRFSS